MEIHKLLEWFHTEYSYLIEEYRRSDHNFSTQYLNPFHLEGDTWAHLCMTLAIAEYREIEDDVKLALFFHDLGKPTTEYRNDETKRVSYIGHEGVSFWMAEDLLRRLEISEERRKRILTIISLHTELFKLFKNGEFNDKKFYAKFAGNAPLVKDLVSHAICDGGGRFFVPNDQELHIKEWESFFKPLIEGIKEPQENKGKKEIIVLAGLPCSGKTTWREKNSEGYTVISIDDILEEWAKAEGKSYNDIWRDKIDDATKEFNLRLSEALKNGENIIVDKTHMSAKSRRRSLGQVTGDYVKKCKLFVTGLDTVIKRDSERVGKTLSFDDLMTLMRVFKVPLYNEFNDIEWIFT